MWGVVVLIPKGGGDYHSIGLVKVVCNVVMVIINHHLRTAISFHDVLHGSRLGHGTGTTSLEAKLLQKLTAMREEVLYVIFMVLYKGYDS